MIGQLEAFSRPRPPAQPGMAEISSRHAAKPFAGQRALIVGGSRGLGEVTAKIVAAGGGHALITYREGAHEAERVAAEITAAGGQCDVMRYDVSSPDRQAPGAIDCCYYFATPKIFQRKAKLYEPDKLQTFLDVYATGLFDLCAGLSSPAGGKIPVFYPSTVAIEHGPGTIAEYAMAKAAGEVLATYINESMSHIHVICRRLPRILTDQTATVGVASSENALDVMLPIVHEMQEMARHLPNARR
jgi:NAD(P)-dependent dehydrogenase (short-subunit alcohol dehydrogenase family)